MKVNKQKDNKQKAIDVVKKHDDTVEVVIRKNPDKTPLGKVVAWVIIIGFVVLPIITLIVTMIQNL